MPTDVERLLINLEVSQKKVEKQLSSIAKTSRRTTTDMKRNFAKANKTVTSQFVNLGQSANDALSGRLIRGAGLATAISLVGIAALEAAKRGERLLIVEKRLEAITGSGERAAASLEAILQVANLTGTSIDVVAGAFSRYTLAAQEIGATTAETERLTQTILQLGAIGGGTQAELSSGAQQLAQSLAKGVLNGDELRSVMENIPLVAKQIADGLGVSVGKLKDMGAAGELTSRKVFDALLAGADDANKKFETLPPTIERASGRMASGWQVFITQINQSIGLSRTLANVINGVADALNLLTRTEDQVLLDTKRRVLKSLDEGESGVRQVSTGPIDADIAIARSTGDTDLVNKLQRDREKAVQSANALLGSSGKRKQILAEISEIEGRIQDKKDNQFDIEKAKATTTGKEKAAKITQATLQADIDKQELAALDSKTRKIKEAGDAAVAAAKAQSGFLSPAQISKIRSSAEQTVQVDITSKANEKASKSGASKGAKQAAKDAKELVDFFKNIEAKSQAMRDEIDLIGLTSTALTKLKAKQDLLAAAKKKGIDLDERSLETGKTVREEINEHVDALGKLAAELERGQISQERFDQALDGIADSFAGAIVAGESLRDNLRGVFQGIAKDMLSSGIKEALGSIFKGGGNSGGGGILSKITGLFGGGGSGGASGGGLFAGIKGILGFAKGSDGPIGNGRVSRSGTISGRGTSTSDSILAVNRDTGRPIALSDKEGIVNAAAMRRNPDLVAAVNRGEKIDGLVV